MITGVVKSFASVAIIRILSRILQFFLRILSPQILAEMIALDLILTTSLHISKQCFKKSYPQVQSKDKQQNILSSMNLMSIGFIATLISAIVVIFLQWHHKIQLQYVNQTILLYGFCALLDALKQKYSVQLVLNYQYKLLGIIQFVSYLPKTFMLFLAARYGMFQKYGIMVFGIGHVIFYGISLIITLLYSKHKNVILMKKFKSQDQKGNKIDIYLDTKTKKILKQLSYISILKLFLQQFQKIVLVFNNAVEDSSIYTLVSNLGSIIVRFIFAPLEQVAYNYYARGNQQQCKKTLISLVKIISIFGMLSTVFGIRYAENVLFMLYGQKWVSQQSILGLQTYMVSIWILGLNGTIDAFVIARADPDKTVPLIKYFTILSTIVYFGSSFLFLHLGLGAAGLFLGNMVGMFVRIIINWNIQIKKHITLFEFIKRSLPSLQFLIILISALIISYQVKPYYPGITHKKDFLIGLTLFFITLSPIVYQYRQQIIAKIKNRLNRNKNENKNQNQNNKDKAKAKAKEV